METAQKNPQLTLKHLVHSHQIKCLNITCKCCSVTYKGVFTTCELILQSGIWESAKVTVTPPERLIASFKWLKLVQIPGTFWLFCRKDAEEEDVPSKNRLWAGGATEIKQLPVVFTVMKARLRHRAKLSYEASPSKNRKWSQTKKFVIWLRV